MTDVETIEPGDATNIAIAKVVGLSFPSQPLTENFGFRSFRPSTDWNDAMYAAEKFGLFDCWARDCVLRSIHGDGEPRLWLVTDKMAYVREIAKAWGASINAPEEYCWDISEAETGPLAICRAILKLHAESTT